MAHDAVRDGVLARQGFAVLRFWTGDVRYDTDWVMDQIFQALGRQSARAPHPDRSAVCPSL
jgi:very-short-patch-repair endonuclease